LISKNYPFRQFDDLILKSGYYLVLAVEDKFNRCVEVRSESESFLIQFDFKETRDFFLQATCELARSPISESISEKNMKKVKAV
jgi:hypothetical protein